MITRRRWPLVGIAAVLMLALPNVAADAEFGPWHFAVTAAGSREFREVYAYRSPRACEEGREAMRRGVAEVLAEHGGTAVRGVARRLRIGPCEAARRAR